MTMGHVTTLAHGGSPPRRAGTLNNLAVFPLERDVFLREWMDGLYGVGPFFFVYSLLELALECVTAGIAGVVVVQCTGLVSDTEAQLVYVAVLVGCLFNGESFGIILNSVVAHAGSGPVHGANPAVSWTSSQESRI